MNGNIANEATLNAAVAQHSNVLLVGGAPHSRLEVARRMLALLPPLTNHGERPFRAPDKSISIQGLCGSESQGMPGEAALAHEGILFIDEIQDFPRLILRALRKVVRSGFSPVNNVQSPAQFLLVAGSSLPIGNIQRDWTATVSALRFRVLLMPP